MRAVQGRGATGFAIAVIATLAIGLPDAQARTYTVNKTADPGPANCQFKPSKAHRNKCSLRSAIDAANAHLGADTIRFRIGEGLKTITPQNALPAISDPVKLDGWTQEGFKGKPLIEINGADFAPSDGILISFGADGSTVKGLIVNGNDNYGIHVLQASGTKVKGCWIGLEPDGKTPRPVGSAGIFLENAPGAVIGGAGAKARNVISGNSDNGISAFSTSSSTPVTIVGNRIGTNSAGKAAVGNSGSGIDLSNAPGAITIGAPGAGNLISGNAVDGVRLLDFDEFNGPVTMQANRIGTSADGKTDLGNGDDGIQHLYPRSNHIGGATPAERNVISGNGGAGIHFEGAYNTGFGATDNWIRGNYIGTNGSGTAGLRNDVEGIWLKNATGDVAVGGGGAGEGNVIAGSEIGLRINGTPGVAVLGNLVGVNKSEEVVGTKLGNAYGIEVSGAGPALIGGAGPGEGNVVSNNSQFGVRIDAIGGGYVAGNFIGTDRGQSASLPNGHVASPGTSAGIVVEGGADARIGEDSLGTPAPNVITHNHGDAIRIEDNSYVEITRNLTAFNDGLGINLAGGTENLSTGVTANDNDDTDTGPNLLMNHPTVTAAAPATGGTDYSVSMDAKPSTTYRIELYANEVNGCDSSGHGEGGFFIASGTLGTNASGIGTTTINGAGASTGLEITATAAFDEFIGTGIEATSEFGPCFTVP